VNGLSCACITYLRFKHYGFEIACHLKYFSNFTPPLANRKKFLFQNVEALVFNHTSSMGREAWIEAREKIQPYSLRYSLLVNTPLRYKKSWIKKT